MEEVLKPIIDAIAELQVTMKWRRMPGYVLADLKPVPGLGPILRVEQRDGVVYATRSNGSDAELEVTWRATQAGWEMVPNV